MHDYATGAMAAQVAMNTTLSAATGGITVFIVAYALTKKYDVGALCNGILAGGRKKKGGFVVCWLLCFGFVDLVLELIGIKHKIDNLFLNDFSFNVQTNIHQ